MRNLVLVLAAAGVAAGTAMLARDWLAEQQRAAIAAVRQPARVEAQTVMVLVARQDLKPGQFVRAEQLRWQAWPTDAVTAAYAVQGKRSEADFVGAVARTPVYAGEPVSEARFVKPGDRGFLAAVLGPEMRAVTVPITATSGNAGFVFPGDRVDLVLTGRMTSSDGQGPQFAATVLESVRVLAIDQRLAAQGGDPTVGRTATLEVTARMAETVSLALAVGNLSLSLRGLGAETGTEGAPVAPPNGPVPIIERDLYGPLLVAGPPAAPAGEAEPPRRPAVTILRGAQASEVQF
ncbi:Flp pilus assembly protein CpaB [Arenibaculum pallidiluteum]|uniref:Flp pilus assembly protein CpaB n=1 Tax=Arenibaculum pallidiluteum TaxID=2812559 RepID=UPI001A96DCA4|nr:Flp pilus assembly protein CpaB [Arenibaculum pallidiluteum]